MRLRFTLYLAEAITVRRAHQDASQVAPQVTPQVQRVIENIRGEMTRGELMEVLELKDRMHFSQDYLQSALRSELIETTIPDKPRSSKQKYRLTEKGRLVLKVHGEKPQSRKQPTASKISFERDANATGTSSPSGLIVYLSMNM